MTDPKPRTELDVAIEMIERNSGYARTTPWWEAIRLVLAAAKAEPESIWMIQRGDYDLDNYRRWTIMEDRGFFLTREEASEYVASISDSADDFSYVEIDRTFGPV